MGEPILSDREIPYQGRGKMMGATLSLSFRRAAKGKQVKIPAPGWGYLYGNVTELRDAGKGPGKSSLFFLTVTKGAFRGPPFKHPGISLSGDRARGLAEHFTFRSVRCAFDGP